MSEGGILDFDNYYYRVFDSHEGGGDARVVEMVVQSTRASLVENKVHFPPYQYGDWVEVVEEDLMNILTWGDERRKGVKPFLFYS